MGKRVGGSFSKLGDPIGLRKYINVLKVLVREMIELEHVVTLMVALCWVPAVSLKKDFSVFWWMVESMYLLLPPPSGHHWKTHHHKAVSPSWWSSGWRDDIEKDHHVPTCKIVQTREIIAVIACDDKVDFVEKKNLLVFLCLFRHFFTL